MKDDPLKKRRNRVLLKLQEDGDHRRTEEEEFEWSARQTEAEISHFVERAKKAEDALKDELLEEIRRDYAEIPLLTRTRVRHSLPCRLLVSGLFS